MFKKFLVISVPFILILCGCSKGEISNTLEAVETGVELTESLLSTTDESNTSEDAEEVVVKYVTDGDTISFFRGGSLEVKGRLIGINAPENTSKKELLGDVSTKYLKDLIEGKKITIERDKDSTDKYGRELIHVFYDGQNINQLLVEQGLASVAYVYDDYKYIDLYKESEEIAKNERRGIWSIPNYVDEESNGYDMSVIQ
ncbi:hypothetical protein EKG37_17970 [Robertmurraya yapensis]|uniref:TNase-like domain-containing protein n=1 Tax=Bacillus yapensis TaxID=2492960 RepID=A0A3S0RH02_9BACI|nr:thermonuclease family protein [Bacillus yapensis]RTR28188.1 hypothetical protein EKG37_17970 [Bacillus yapensis]TKS94432.1 hypothetical protein FAR12_17980 [Bacillus yapensis]